MSDINAQSELLSKITTIVTAPDIIKVVSKKLV